MLVSCLFNIFGDFVEVPLQFPLLAQLLAVEMVGEGQEVRTLDRLVTESFGATDGKEGHVVDLVVVPIKEMMSENRVCAGAAGAKLVRSH